MIDSGIPFAGRRWILLGSHRLVKRTSGLKPGRFLRRVAQLKPCPSQGVSVLIRKIRGRFFSDRVQRRIQIVENVVHIFDPY